MRFSAVSVISVLAFASVKRAHSFAVGSSCFALKFPSSSVKPLIRQICSKSPLSMSVSKSEQEWRTVLSPQQFAVLREKATERPGSSPLNKLYPKDGTFECVACNAPLYTGKSKFDSGCGWPAFYEGIPGAIKEVADADGRRVEILCNNCGSHLGHVFKNEGFPTPTNERHCVNGICLKYTPA